MTDPANLYFLSEISYLQILIEVDRNGEGINERTGIKNTCKHIQQNTMFFTFMRVCLPLLIW
jgi:hypothetical protein